MDNQPGASKVATTLRTEGSARQAAFWGIATLAGIVVYVVLDSIAQTLPPQLNPIATAESDLAAVAPFGWIMTINFVIRGLLSLCLLLGLRAGLAPRARSGAGMLCFVIWTLGAFVLALFPTDIGPHRTLHGLIHLVVALIAFIGGAVGAMLLSARLAADARWTRARPVLLVVAVTSLLPLVGVVLFGASHVFGLVERLFLGLVLLWIALAALELVRHGPGTSQSAVLAP